MRLAAAALRQLLALAQAAPQHEVCGVLLGPRADHAATIVAGRNVAAAPATTFLLDAATLLAADAQARAAGLCVVGFFHSHPASVPFPSSSDRASAWPDTWHLIVGRVGATWAVTAWQLGAGRVVPGCIVVR